MLFHETAQTCRGAADCVILEFLPDATVTVAAAVAFEDLFDENAEPDILLLSGSGHGGMIKAAARQLQSVADLADAGAGPDPEWQAHRAGLSGGGVPRMTAAFLKCRSPCANE